MPAPVANHVPDPAALAPAALRAELSASEQRYLGRAYVVLKNPVSLSYSRLLRPHYLAARRFDGRTTLGAVATALAREDAYWRALSPARAVEELNQLARQLALAGALLTSGQSALRRIEAVRGQRKRFRLDAAVGSILFIKRSLFDPDRLLARMLPWFGWVYTRGFVAAFVLGWLATGWLLGHRGSELARQGASFFTLQNLALTWVTFLGIKTIHEFGHGLTCKRFGGEVHEMGVLLIMFTPYLYCNVSDSWVLPDKRQRILITAAGIFVEMTLALVAAWVWLATQPGLVHQIAFNTIFTCTVSTVLFNANPLLKYDGYYMLSDALEVPNLKAKSNAAATAWAQRWLLGLRRTATGVFGHEVRPLFGLYAVVSYLYGWLILYRISTHLFDALAPYGLDFLSRTYVGLFLFTGLALPMHRLIKSTAANPAARAAAGRRLMRLAALLAVALVGSAFLPWGDRIKRGVVLEQAGIEPIAARAPGFVREVFVRDGERVRAGQPLARLESFELAGEVDDLALQAAGYEVQRRSALADPVDAVRGSAASFARLKAETDLQLAHKRWLLGECTLRAPRDGVVRGVELTNLVGQYLARGRTVCELGAADTYRAVISLDESEARRVAVGQPVAVRLGARSGETWTGTITAAPVSSLTRLTLPASASVAGGDVPAQANAQGALEPSVGHYEAETLLRDPGGERLRAGLMGRARIEVGRTTLGRWLWERALDLVNPGLRL